MPRRRTHSNRQTLTYSKVQELMASPTEPLDDAQRTHHLLRVYRGLCQLEEAERPTVDDWLACSEAIGTTEALIALGAASDSTGFLGAAAETLARVAQAGIDRHVARLEGPGRTAVREVVDCYADMLAELPARTVIRAHRHSALRQGERIAPAPRPGRR